jgi:1,4-alpha-glucan branching enzyme
VVGDFSDYKMSNTYLMNNTPDGRYWWIDIPNLEPSRLYTYQYLVDGEIRIADPMSELILDSQNDKDIKPSVYSDIPAFPTGKTSGIVTVFRPEKENFSWQYDDYQRPDPTNLFIYELLMRDFMEDQSYQNLKDTLDYLERLGVTAIELMPVNEFENNDSWGYNPSFHMALDKYYGSPESFKRFVDECHRRGIAVLVDVVFNHVFGQSPLARLYWDKDRNRPAPDNPWLNTEPKHPYNVGYDVNHESQATREWMDQILRYMIEEYHIDGYRFDLTKGFTQRQSTEATASNYDASRVAILKRMADKIREYDPESILILEHFCENREERELADYGFFFWGNLNYSYNEATMGYHDNNKSNFNWISHKQRGWQRPHVVGYMESHDEERLMYKNLQFGSASGSYSVKNLSTALKRIELAVPLFLLIPGPKMIWQFGELGYEFSINTCEDRTVQPQCRLARKPILWDYLEDDRRRDVYNVFADMANLKKEQSVFKSDDFSLNVTGSFKSMQIKSPGHHIQVMGNFDTRTLTSGVTFPTTGVYYEYFTGDTLRVQSNPVQISLNAGEYRLYSDVFMGNNSMSSSVSDAVSEQPDVKIFPNPAQNHLNIDIKVLQAQKHHIELTGLDGKVVMRISDIFLTPGLNEIEADISQVPAGMYFIRIWSTDQHIVRRLSVVR